jgi:hypothetical protein
LIVDPPNGRLPALTAAAQKREADRRANSRALPASYTDFTLYERCITRGLIGSVMPGGYNNGNQIFQAPGYVTIVNEMIHESRFVRWTAGRMQRRCEAIWGRAAGGTAIRWWSRPRTSSIAGASAGRPAVRR